MKWKWNVNKLMVANTNIKYLLEIPTLFHRGLSLATFENVSTLSWQVDIYSHS